MCGNQYRRCKVIVFQFKEMRRWKTIKTILISKSSTLSQKGSVIIFPWKSRNSGMSTFRKRTNSCLVIRVSKILDGSLPKHLKIYSDTRSENPQPGCVFRVFENSSSPSSNRLLPNVVRFSCQVQSNSYPMDYSMALISFFVSKGHLRPEMHAIAQSQNNKRNNRAEN